MSAPPRHKSLPATITPSHYALLISTNTSDHPFIGRVSISLVVNEDTSTVSLNSKDLKIMSHMLVDSEKKSISYKFFETPEEQVITLNLDEALKKDERVTLVLLFEGGVSKAMNGYYVSTYTKEGEEKFMYSTHFEPTSARTAFPCFDQPDHKATFRVTLVVPEEFVALSNSEIEKVEKVSDKISSIETSKDKNNGDE